MLAPVKDIITYKAKSVQTHIAPIEEISSMHMDMVGSKREFPHDRGKTEISETPLEDGDINMQHLHKRRFLKSSGSKNDIDAQIS